jgi:Flp pilus assembly protein TadG
MRKHLNISENKGATILEFTLVIPVFALLIFGILEFGFYFFVEHTIQHATREGTRIALVGLKLQNPDNTYMTCEQSIIKTIKDNASFAVNPNDLQVSIFPVGPGYSDPSTWNTTVNAGSGGDYMRVRVLYTFRFHPSFIGRFFPSGTNVIQAQTLYRNELFSS